MGLHTGLCGCDAGLSPGRRGHVWKGALVEKVDDARAACERVCSWRAIYDGFT
jgi:hypothetical protein